MCGCIFNFCLSLACALFRRGVLGTNEGNRKGYPKDFVVLVDVFVSLLSTALQVSKRKHCHGGWLAKTWLPPVFRRPHVRGCSFYEAGVNLRVNGGHSRLTVMLGREIARVSVWSRYKIRACIVVDVDVQPRNVRKWWCSVSYSNESRTVRLVRMVVRRWRHVASAP